MTRAVIYARVSSAKQVEGYSLETQTEGCEGYAERNAFSIIDRIEDPGFSGATLDRPGLTRLRKLAATGKMDAVLIYARDRLARELIQDLALCAELRAAGVAIHDVARNKVLIGDFSDHIDAIISEEERRRILKRTVEGRQARVNRGQFPAQGKPPYGYQAEGSGKNRTIVVFEEEARIVRLIYAWYTSGDGNGVPLSTTEIAYKLTELQIPTRYDLNGRVKKRGYAHWSPSTVFLILKQSAYRGIYFAYRFKMIEGRAIRTKPDAWQPVPVPAIIDNDLWEAAQRQIVLNRNEAKRKTVLEYLFRCRVKCKCGYAAFAKARKAAKDRRPEQQYKAYVCSGKGSKRATHCPYGALSFGARRVDALVWEWIVSTILDEDAVRRGYDKLAFSRASEMERLQNERRIYTEQYLKCRQEIDSLLVLYRSTRIKPEYLDAHIQPLQEAVERLESEIADIDRRIAEQDVTEDDLAAVLAFANLIREKVANFTFEQRRQLVELLDVRIELAIEDGVKVLYVTSRIDTARLTLEIKQATGNYKNMMGTEQDKEREKGGEIRTFELTTTRS